MTGFGKDIVLSHIHLSTEYTWTSPYTSSNSGPKCNEWEGFDHKTLLGPDVLIDIFQPVQCTGGIHNPQGTRLPFLTN